MTLPTARPGPSLQERFAPATRCFGCGPANANGLHIGSREAMNGRDGELVATWRAQPHHAAFENVLNGGIVGTLLDCHGNWTAAMRIMRDRGLDRPPGCVTADYAIRLRRPTPVDRELGLHAWPVSLDGDRVVVDGEIVVDGIITATCRGTFVAVKEGHPAFHRW